MCVGMNDDRLTEGQRCASTSNRNFEGRQGAGGRTHLVSPIMAAAAALTRVSMRCQKAWVSHGKAGQTHRRCCAAFGKQH